MAVIALIQALTAKLIQLRNQNQSWRIYRGMYIDENKWRAVRYGIDGKLIDFGKQEEIPMRFLARELIDIVDDVLDDLDSRTEIGHLKTMLEEGTSADRQLKVYHCALNDGAAEREALHAVVDHLIEETALGWQHS